MDKNKVQAVFILGILISILVACGGEPVGNLSTATPTVWFTDTPATTSTVAKPSTLSATQTLIPLSVYTERARQSTAIAIATTEIAARKRAQDNKETQVAQFSVDCAEMGISQISPDGNWVAVSCGYKRDQTLIVKSRQGAIWMLKAEDFMFDYLFPEYWSPDSRYLYFSAANGYDGGGNQCFPEHLYRGSRDGLYQLNLNNGSWVMLLPPADSFPGYGIRFSPTGQKYAVNLNGITIADLKSGELIQIDTSEVMDLLWSPDGRYLAYSIANCDEAGWVQSASVYVWDSSTNRTQKIFSIKVEQILLYPEVWIDNSTIRVSVEKRTDRHPPYEIYDFDIASGSLILWGTATPHP